jgi:Protein of unknown function (DUF2800)
MPLSISLFFIMKTKTKTERAHHPFSPSTLQFREACPYYDPLGTNNAAAELGTRHHEAIEQGDDESLSDKQASIVADCLTYFDALKARYPGCTVIAEEYLPIDDEEREFIDWKGQPQRFKATTAGYLDRALITADQKHAELCDWKFGEWDVEPAENNTQGMAYLLGLFKRFPTLQKVGVHFVMPYRDEVSYCLFTREQFSRLYWRIRTIVMRALLAREQRDFTKAKPSLGACLWCGNAGRCDALAEIALKIGHKFAPVHIPADITPSLLQDPKMAGEGLRIAGIVGAWAAAYRMQKTAQALENDVIPEGYQLVTSVERKIIDSKKLREVCLQFGLTDEEIDTAAKFYITPIDELIRAKAPRGSKDATVEAVSKAFLEAGAVEMGEPTASLRMKKKS